MKVSGLILTNEIAFDSFVKGIMALLLFNENIHVTIIPGGGHEVDELRASFQDTNISDEERESNLQEIYHWQSVDVMDKNAKLIKDRFALHDRVFVPAIKTVLEEEQPQLPRSWDVTSDSITYWLACRDRTTMPTIILLKDVDGVISPATGSEVTRRAGQPAGKLLKEIKVREARPKPQCPSFPFDQFLFTLVERYRVPFYIINVSRLERLQQLAASREDFPFTLVAHEE